MKQLMLALALFVTVAPMVEALPMMRRPLAAGIGPMQGPGPIARIRAVRERMQERRAARAAAREARAAARAAAVQ